MVDDTIVALATPAGRSALALIRLSGKDCFEVAARVIGGFTATPARTATLAPFRYPTPTHPQAEPELIDRGLYTAFPGPHSYTGEDMVELSCHGGLLTPSRLLAALEAAGARPAARGEFTRRAVLNGKLDLIQAEAVGDLIDAEAGAQGRAALLQLEGGLSRRIEDLRRELIEVMALLSYDIDFPEEDDGPVGRKDVAQRLDGLAVRIERLLATAPEGERLREGALVVLAGKPNAGKSSLFNALLGRERALVTEEAGTTRDAIEAETEFLGWPVRLVDTAGLRPDPERIEAMGIEMARRYLGAADLVILLVEAGRDVDSEELALLQDSDIPTVLVRSKADALAREPSDRPDDFDGTAVSAYTGLGLDSLRESVARTVFHGRTSLADLEPMLTRERHRTALEESRLALSDAAEQLASGDALLVSHHVQQAVSALDNLIGIVDIEEVLDRVFASFCVGK